MEVNIFNVKPDYSMTFSKDGETVGRMEWNDGVMKFTGNAEESAKVFFDWLKPYMDGYMKNAEEGIRDKCATAVDHILKEGGGTYGDFIRTVR